LARSEALLLYLLTVWGLWGAEFYNLLPNQAFASANGVQVLVTAAFLSTIASVIGFLSYRFWPSSSKTEPIQIEVKYPVQPVLDLRPLPHYRGYELPLKIEIRDLGNGMKEAKGTNPGASTPEYNLLELSQKLEVWKGKLDEPMQELIAKFGVVRVRCTSGDVIDCKAQARVRIIQLYGQVHPTNFVDWGYLNWYSVAIKKDIQGNRFDEIYPVKHLGLNKYLKNVSMDLHQGDEKDLLIFYMIKDIPNVFICSDVETAQAGSIFSSNQTLKFEIEISVTAQRYPKNTWSYFVTITDFDEFKLEPK
jgi:hypothetical protein